MNANAQTALFCLREVADVACASREGVRELGDRPCFVRAPEICIEGLSPSNLEAEMNEKRGFYFDAGAREVWFCSDAGTMSFYGPGGHHLEVSLCPSFPKKVELKH